MAKRTAVIDLGSNSMRMVIFDKSSRYAFSVVGEFKMKVRLGEGAYENGGAIGERSMQKAFEAFSEFKNIAKAYKCAKIFAMGTSALRDAPNAGELIGMARKELGINLKVVSGKDEATFGGVAALNLLEPLEEFVTLDIGGGSAELALVSGGKIIDAASLNLGTVRLKELFFDKKNLSAAQPFIKDALKSLPKNFKSKNLVAIGGSLRAISSAIMSSQNYPLKTVHNFAYKLQNHKNFIESISQASVLELGKFGIKKDRFDTIREGALIFLSAAEALGAQNIYTSGAGFREGVFLSDILRPTRKFPPNFNPSVRSLQDRFLLGENKTIVKYTKDIFAALEPLHELGGRYENELAVAAKLHDVAQCLGFYGEHASSAFFVLNALNYGFSHAQKCLIAAIIAQNGKKSSSEFERFKDLLPSESVVRWLSFILALAKNLDVNCAHKKLEFEFINHTLQIYGAKELFMAKENIKKMTKPDTFAICFA
jgi:ethanolamine utilisation protein eutA|nr:Ppx/GppA phosphatase family protein [uncultured Campylobacter sp.]